MRRLKTNPENLRTAFEKLQAENPLLTQAIAIFCGEGDSARACEQNGLAAIRANPAVLATVTKERTFNFLSMIDEHRLHSSS